MSHKSKTIAIIGISLIILIVTLVVFFLGYTNHPNKVIDWIGLTFVLISEIALFGGTTAILLRKYTGSQKLFVLGIFSILCIYFTITCILSIFSKNIFENNVRGFTTTQIIIMAIVLIISILLYTIGISVTEKDSKIMYSRLIMKDCESLAFSLKSNAKFHVYFSLLNKIYEEIKYSDKTKSINEEQAIYDKINKLEEVLSNNKSNPKVEDISIIVDEIVLLIKKRNLSVLQLNQGEF